MIKTTVLTALLFLCLGFTSNAQDASEVEYTLLITNLVGNKPTVSDLKEGNVIINYFYNGQDMEVIYKCCKLVHVPKRGEMSAPITCCENGIADMKTCISSIDLKEGDRLFIEDIVVELNGKETKIKGTALSF